jgi:hypothetical protein
MESIMSIIVMFDWQQLYGLYEIVVTACYGHTQSQPQQHTEAYLTNVSLVQAADEAKLHPTPSCMS